MTGEIRKYIKKLSLKKNDILLFNSEVLDREEAEEITRESRALGINFRAAVYCPSMAITKLHIEKDRRLYKYEKPCKHVVNEDVVPYTIQLINDNEIIQEECVQCLCDGAS